MRNFQLWILPIKWRSSLRHCFGCWQVFCEKVPVSPHHRLWLVSVLVDSVTFHCCFTSFFWIWLWILCCPEAYCNNVFLATFMISCFSETEEVCLRYIFISTLCFLFPFQCTDSHVAQLCMWVVKLVLAIHMNLTEQLFPKHWQSLVLVQVRFIEKEQRTRDILSCIHGIMKNDRCKEQDIVVLLDWLKYLNTGRIIQGGHTICTQYYCLKNTT